MANRWGNNGKCQTLFSWTQESLQMVAAAMKLKDISSLEEKLWQTWQRIKKQRYHFADKVSSSQSYGFSSSQVWMWTIKKPEHWRIDAFELWCWARLLISSCKEIQPVHPKGNQPWILIEAEALIVWPPDAKNWLTGKDPEAGKGWRQEEKGMTENEMVGWHHRLNRHEFEWTLGHGEGKGSLECCSPWGFRVRHYWEAEQQQVLPCG